MPRPKDEAGTAEMIADLDERIRAVTENIRGLIEEAAGYSGAAADELNSKRIAEQEEQLSLLKQKRDQIMGRMN